MEKRRNVLLTSLKSILMNVSTKIPLTMKCTLFILFAFVGLAFADNGYAQKTELNLSMKNQSVEEILNEIEKNTGFSFFYNDNAIDTERRVSVSVEKGHIQEVLDQVFAGTSIGYKVTGKNIVLYNKKTENADNVLELSPEY